MYILDEPSIGLHPRDTQRLIQVLLSLRDVGNTLVVVEHDEEIMRSADHLIDIGPDAGRLGGELVYAGTVEKIASETRSYTGKYLSGQERIPLPYRRRKGHQLYQIGRRPGKQPPKHYREIPVGAHDRGDRCER